MSESHEEHQDASSIDRTKESAGNHPLSEPGRRERHRMDGRVIGFFMLTGVLTVIQLAAVYSGAMSGATAAMVTAVIVTFVPFVGMLVSSLLSDNKPTSVVGALAALVVVGFVMVIGVLPGSTQSYAAIFLGNHTLDQPGLAGWLFGMPTWLYVVLVIVAVAVVLWRYAASVRSLEDETNKEQKQPRLRVMLFVVLTIILIGVFMIVAMVLMIYLLDLLIGVALAAAVILVGPPLMLTSMIFWPERLVGTIVSALVYAIGMTLAIGLSVIIATGM